MTKAKAVFLDRDDTLIRNVPYLGDPTQVVLFPDVRESLERLAKAGFLLFIVSNQSGVGRGYISQAQVEAVQQEMIRQIGKNYFQEIYNCYAAPGQPGSEIRKPSPALLLRAKEEHQLDLKKSFFIGDRSVDMNCGKRAGCRPVLVLTGPQDTDQNAAREVAEFVSPSLKTAVTWILSQSV